MVGPTIRVCHIAFPVYNSSPDKKCHKLPVYLESEESTCSVYVTDLEAHTASIHKKRCLHTYHGVYSHK